MLCVAILKRTGLSSVRLLRYRVSTYLLYFLSSLLLFSSIYSVLVLMLLSSTCPVHMGWESVEWA